MSETLLSAFKSELLNVNYYLAPILLGLATVVYLIQRKRYWARLPPGPPGIPILGNALQLASTPWLQMTKWSKQYGPLFSLNLFGTTAIVINNHQIAAEILDKRSAATSDRPRFIMTSEVLCGGQVMSFMRSGSKLSRLRKAACEGLNSRAIQTYSSIREREAVLLVEDLSRDPEHWSDHVHRQVASAILSTVYGLPPMKPGDPTVQRIEAFDHDLERIAQPGAYLVELFPWLDKLPLWMLKGKQEVMKLHQGYANMFVGFYRDAKERVAAEECGPCVSSALAKNSNIDEDEAAWTAGILFGGGTATTVGAQRVFVLAMLTFPEVMRKAQEEIDEVVGRGRLPNSGDRDKLPYIRAIVRETLRWRSIGPLGLPHMFGRDEMYEGYLIPKGTIAFYNLWALNNDPEVYPEPDEFRPERFLDETGKNEIIPPYTHGEGHLAFGYGRRVCVGGMLANETLFLNIATLLWTFNIEKAKDKDGNSITPGINDFIGDVITYNPAPFPASFVFRHPDIPEILAQEKLDRFSHF